MAAKNRGQLIKEARMAAGLTQEQLARKVKGATAADIGRAERSEGTLTNEQIKAIAKATGVTQKSLLDAPVPKKATTSGKTAAKTSGKTTSAKTQATGGYTIKVTAAEKKLIQMYRKADDSSKKAALAILVKSSSNDIGGMLGTLVNGKDIKDLLSGLQSFL